MRAVTESAPISLDDLRAMAGTRFGDLIKAVLDIKRRVMLVDAELHADQEAALLAEGSRQEDLWGINLCPQLPQTAWIEFDSLNSYRPSFGNRLRGVVSVEAQETIVELVGRMVVR